MRILSDIAEDAIELASISLFLAVTVGWLAGVAGQF
jgi:hypothetical protein